VTTKWGFTAVENKSLYTFGTKISIIKTRAVRLKTSHKNGNTGSRFLKKSPDSQTVLLAAIAVMVVHVMYAIVIYCIILYN